jgi:hypothetical protein
LNGPLSASNFEWSAVLLIFAASDRMVEATVAEEAGAAAGAAVYGCAGVCASVDAQSNSPATGALSARHAILNDSLMIFSPNPHRLARDAAPQCCLN